MDYSELNIDELEEMADDGDELAARILEVGMANTASDFKNVESESEVLGCLENLEGNRQLDIYSEMENSEGITDAILKAQYQRYLKKDYESDMLSLLQLQKAGDVFVGFYIADLLIKANNNSYNKKGYLQFRNAVNNLNNAVRESGTEDEKIINFLSSMMVRLGDYYIDNHYTETGVAEKAFESYSNAYEANAQNAWKYIECLKSGIGCNRNKEKAQKIEERFIENAGFEKLAVYALFQFYKKDLNAEAVLATALMAKDAPEFPFGRIAINVLLDYLSEGLYSSAQYTEKYADMVECNNQWAIATEAIKSTNPSTTLQIISRFEGEDGDLYELVKIIKADALARKAREEAERLEQECRTQKEAERLAQEQRAREEAERLEQKRRAQEEAEHLERERRAQEEAERWAREEAELSKRLGYKIKKFILKHRIALIGLIVLVMLLPSITKSISEKTLEKYFGSVSQYDQICSMWEDNINKELYEVVITAYNNTKNASKDKTLKSYYKEACNGYEIQAVDTINGYMESAEYKKAKEFAINAQKLLPDSKKVNKAAKKLDKEYSEELLKEIDILIAAQNYSEVIVFINSECSYYIEDTTFKNLCSKCEKVYEKNVLDKVKEEKINGNIEAILITLSDALLVLPKNEKFISEFEAYDNEYCIVSVDYGSTIDFGKGVAKEYINTGIHRYEDADVISLDIPSEKGWEFLGWNTSADGSGTHYGAISEYKPKHSDSKYGKITLYAIWRAIEYRINIDKITLNGTHSDNYTSIEAPEKATLGDLVRVSVIFTKTYEGRSIAINSECGPVELFYDEYCVQPVSGTLQTEIKNESETMLITEDSIDFYFVMPDCEVTITTYNGCVTKDTQILLADGSTVQVQDLTGEEEILSWDFYSGKLIKSRISVLNNHGEAINDVLYLVFDDGSELGIIEEHGLYDNDIYDFVYLSIGNYTEYIGHQFLKYTSDSINQPVTLIGGHVVTEVNTAYSVWAAKGITCFMNGFLTIGPDAKGLGVSMFDIVDMKYSEEQIEIATQTYGLYSYDDWKDVLTREQFEAFNTQYLKILVAKGKLTEKQIMDYIEGYLH